MANPVFNNNPVFNGRSDGRAPIRPNVIVPSAEQLDEQYAMPAPSADQLGRMTYEDTVVKTLVSFGVLVVGAALGWAIGANPIVMVGAALIGFVLAMVNTFKKKPSAPLVLAYAAVEGVFVGAISQFYTVWTGGSAIVPMAVFGTLGVVGVTLALFASGKVRATKRATKIFLVALIGYAVFSLVNVVLVMTGVSNSMYGIRDALIPGTQIPIGVPLGLLVVVLAAYSLVLDFDSIKRGVDAGAPRAYGWTAAFGIMVTVVWLYLEILRLLSYFFGRR